MRIVVIGAGVSGLSSAHELLRAGHAVTILGRELPPHTTSNAAAAVWLPYSVRGAAAGDVERWGGASLERFATLAAVPEAGVIQREVLDLHRQAHETPDWSASVPDFHLAGADDLPPGCVMGFAFSAPVIDMSLYLDWLRREVERLGGTVRQEEIPSLDALPTEYDAVVNCAGLGARKLAPDDAARTRDGRGVYAGRGQVVRVRATGFARVVSDDDDPLPPTYIVPRIHDIVLGGFNQPRENLAADPAQSDDILRRCAVLAEFFDPAFAARLRALLDPTRAGAGVEPAEITSVGVGLRPLRETVRLELARVAGRPVIHNYGHGGAGVTLSWGCAADVARLVEGL